MRAKATAVRGGLGACPPRKFLNFRSSKIDSGAFWDDFPACQGTRTNCNRCCKSVTLYNTLTQNDRSNFALISISYRPLPSIYELQVCERPDEEVVGCAAAVCTRELLKVMNIDYLIAEKWSGFGQTNRTENRTGSADPVFVAD